MNSLSCELPPHVEFSIPREYLLSRAGEGIVSLFNEKTMAKTLTVRWDDTYLQFLANNQGVSFLREKITRIVIDKNEKVMNWTICTLRVSDCNGAHLVLSVDKQFEPELDQVVQDLKSKSVPL